MIKLLALLDVRSPERDLPFDPFKMQRVFIIQDASDSRELAAVAEYPNGLGVAYRAGNMSLHGGGGGLNFAEKFGNGSEVTGSKPAS